jgi:hypothetical protein
MTLSFFEKLQAGFVKDEQWVLSEITKGWQLLQTVGHTVDVDIHNIFSWIQTHQGNILAIFQQALSAMTIVGAVIPGIGPGVAAATEAINVATVAVNVLSKSVIAGSTPLSTAVNAYHAVKDAQTAVNAVLKHATTNPQVLKGTVPVEPANDGS